MKVRVKQNALIARLAAKRLKEEQMAIVVGKIIYLWNISAKDFLENKKWLRHEAMHVKQFQQNGLSGFLFLYLKESLKNGYENNKFEVEARLSENDESILEDIRFEI